MVVGPPFRPVILFHHIDHARAIVETSGIMAVPVCAVSAPGVNRYLGTMLLKEIVDRAGLEDAVIDCGNSSESVQLALKTGWQKLAFAPDHPAFDKIASLAGAYGAKLVAYSELPPPGAACLDLAGSSDPVAACKDFLKQFAR